MIVSVEAKGLLDGAALVESKEGRSGFQRDTAL
jgi:hypothetical protein